MRSTSFGIFIAAVGQFMCVTGVLEEFFAAPLRGCYSTGGNGWLIAAALGPMFILVGVAVYVNGRADWQGAANGSASAHARQRVG